MVAAMAPCRLYLTLPAACAAGLESSLAQALDQADAACVLLCGDAAPSDTPWDLRLREVRREREVASAFGPAKANETARLAELIAWWAEIFEVPCVPWDVETAEEAESLLASARISSPFPQPSGKPRAWPGASPRSPRLCAG